jgi:hypothetical protein
MTAGSYVADVQRFAIPSQPNRILPQKIFLAIPFSRI